MGKKILILTNLDIGLYKFRKELIEELQSRGNEIYLSLPYGKLVDKLVDKGCRFIETPIERRGMNPLQDSRIFFQYRKILKQVRPELVIAYTIKPNIYGGIAARLAGIPYAVNITGLGTAFQKENFIKKMVVQMYKSACKKAKVVFFENEENQRVFIENKIVRKEKTCRLNGAGVNLKAYPFTPYPKDDKEVRFLFVGRVMREKGVDELFEAFEKLKLRYPQVMLDVVGPYEDDYKETVEALVQKKVINYYGYQEDVRPFIERSHCFVLPSYHEGMANTLLEAGAMGRPLITSDIPGCREAVSDGESGYLTFSQDGDMLEEKLEQFMRIPFMEKESMGKASYKRISGIFDKKLVVEETIKKLTCSID